MAFKRIYSTEVFDEDRGVTVKMAFRFRDILNQFTLCYSDSMVTFEFEVVSEVGMSVSGALEPRATSPQPTTLATHILERTVREGLVRALGGDALSKVNYEAIKAAIQEGVYLLDSDWGKQLKLAPEYKVDFVD